MRRAPTALFGNQQITVHSLGLRLRAFMVWRKSMKTEGTMPTVTVQKEWSLKTSQVSHAEHYKHRESQ